MTTTVIPSDQIRTPEQRILYTTLVSEGVPPQLALQVAVGKLPVEAVAPSDDRSAIETILGATALAAGLAGAGYGGWQLAKRNRRDEAQGSAEMPPQGPIDPESGVVARPIEGTDLGAMAARGLSRAPASGKPGLMEFGPKGGERTRDEVVVNGEIAGIGNLYSRWHFLNIPGVRTELENALYGNHPPEVKQAKVQNVVELIKRGIYGQNRDKHIATALNQLNELIVNGGPRYGSNNELTPRQVAERGSINPQIKDTGLAYSDLAKIWYGDENVIPGQSRRARTQTFRGHPKESGEWKGFGPETLTKEDGRGLYDIPSVAPDKTIVRNRQDYVKDMIKAKGGKGLLPTSMLKPGTVNITKIRGRDNENQGREDDVLRVKNPDRLPPGFAEEQETLPASRTRRLRNPGLAMPQALKDLEAVAARIGIDPSMVGRDPEILSPGRIAQINAALNASMKPSEVQSALLKLDRWQTERKMAEVADERTGGYFGRIAREITPESRPHTYVTNIKEKGKTVGSIAQNPYQLAELRSRHGAAAARFNALIRDKQIKALVKSKRLSAKALYDAGIQFAADYGVAPSDVFRTALAMAHSRQAADAGQVAPIDYRYEKINKKNQDRNWRQIPAPQQVVKGLMQMPTLDPLAVTAAARSEDPAMRAMAAAAFASAIPKLAGLTASQLGAGRRGGLEGDLPGKGALKAFNEVALATSFAAEDFRLAQELAVKKGLMSRSEAESVDFEAFMRPYVRNAALAIGVQNRIASDSEMPTMILPRDVSTYLVGEAIAGNVDVTDVINDRVRSRYNAPPASPFDAFLRLDSLISEARGDERDPNAKGWRLANLLFTESPETVEGTRAAQLRKDIENTDISLSFGSLYQAPRGFDGDTSAAIADEVDFDFAAGGNKAKYLKTYYNNKTGKQESIIKGADVYYNELEKIENQKYRLAGVVKSQNANSDERLAARQQLDLLDEQEAATKQKIQMLGDKDFRKDVEIAISRLNAGQSFTGEHKGNVSLMKDQPEYNLKLTPEGMELVTRALERPQDKDRDDFIRNVIEAESAPDVFSRPSFAKAGYYNRNRVVGSIDAKRVDDDGPSILPLDRQQDIRQQTANLPGAVQEDDDIAAPEQAPKVVRDFLEPVIPDRDPVAESKLRAYNLTRRFQQQYGQASVVANPQKIANQFGIPADELRVQESDILAAEERVQMQQPKAKSIGDKDVFTAAQEIARNRVAETYFGEQAQRHQEGYMKLGEDRPIKYTAPSVDTLAFMRARDLARKARRRDF